MVKVIVGEVAGETNFKNNTKGNQYMRFSILGKKFIYAIVVGGVLVSCTSETPETGNNETLPPSIDNTENGNNENESYKMRCIVGEADNSRASVDEDSMNGGTGSSNTFRWDTNDQITIWTGQDATSLSKCLFTTKDGGSGSALFEYEGKEVESNKYFGYYPYSEILDYKHIEISIPTDGSIIQTIKGSSQHIAPYRPMYSNVVNRQESSETLTGLEFSHITSLLYFRVRNLSGRNVNLEGITIKCSENVFSSTATLAFNPEGEASFNMSENTKSDFATLSFGDNGSGIAWENEEITTGFLPILPVEDLSEKTLTLTLKVDNQEYISMEINNAESFKQAHFYRFGLTLKEIGITVDSFIEEWGPGEDIIIPAKQ